MKNRRHEGGQFLIEALLLMTIMVFILVALGKQLKESKIIPGLVTKPWAKLAGMAENGVWADPDDEARHRHPNTFNRFSTPKEPN